MDINQTYCSDHFAIYTDIKSCCAVETLEIQSMAIISQLKKQQTCVLHNFLEDPQVAVRLTHTIPYMLINAAVKQAGPDLAY